MARSPIIKQPGKIYDEVEIPQKEIGMEASIKASTLKNVGFLHVVRFLVVSIIHLSSKDQFSKKKLKNFLSSHFTQLLASTPVFSVRT